LFSWQALEIQKLTSDYNTKGYAVPDSRATPACPAPTPHLRLVAAGKPRCCTLWLTRDDGDWYRDLDRKVPYGAVPWPAIRHHAPTRNAVIDASAGVEMASMPDAFLDDHH
jgi:hypothetical protein